MSPLQDGQCQADQLDRLEELLDDWEASVSRGEKPDPQVICKNQPNLLSQFLEILDNLGQTDWIERHVSNTKPVNPTLKQGDEIIPKHFLQEKIGSGGFGQVWRATGPGGVQVALKCLWLGEHRTRLEWKALSQLKTLRHPHLLGLFGYWVARGWLVIGSELAAESLANHSRTNGGKESATVNPQFEKSKLLQFLRDAADGLDYLHALPTPLIHGDVKPGNLLLVGGRCKVGDFGLIRKITQANSIQADGLTIRYAAPEALLGQAVRASDQFSLAVTYCSLKGVEPYPGEGVGLAQAHLEMPPDLSAFSAPEAKVLAKAMAKDPAHRFPDCLSFIEALAEADRLSNCKTRTSLSTGLLPLVALATLIVIPCIWVFWPKDRLISNPPRRLKDPIVLPVAPNFRENEIASMCCDQSGNLMALNTKGHPAFFSLGRNKWHSEQPQTRGGLVRLFPSLDRKTVFAGQGQEPFDIEEWEPSTQRILRRIHGNTGFVRNVAVDEAGQQLATANYAGEINVFDLKNGQKTWGLSRKPFRFQSVRFTGDGGSVIFSAEEGHLLFSKIGSDQAVSLLPKSNAQYWSIEKLEGEDKFVVGSTTGKLLVVDPANVLQPKIWAEYGQAITTVAIEPNSGLMAVGTGNIYQTLPNPDWLIPDTYPLHLLDSKTGKSIGSFYQHTGPIQSIEWALDGRTLFTSASDGTLVRWTVE